jgi:hypothetical protein
MKHDKLSNSFRTDVLIFVEDPGAANYAMHLPQALSRSSIRARLFAGGHARYYLKQRGINSEIFDQGMQSQEILANVQPRLVIVGTSENPDTPGFQLIEEARLQKIESVVLIDASGNADYRLRGRTDNPLAYVPDWLIVPDDWTKASYVNLGFPSERVLICGHPHYDYVRECGAKFTLEDKNGQRKRLFHDVQDGQKIVIFASEISTGLNPEQYQISDDYTLKGRGRNSDRTSIVLEEFLDAVKNVSPRPYLVLRLHPKNTVDELSQFADTFDQISINEPPLELIYFSDLVVGMTTILLFEAALLGKLTLSIVPRSEEKVNLPSVRTGMTSCVTTRSELRTVLARMLNNTWPDHTNTREVFISDSMRRVSDFIENLVFKGRTTNH